jgi:ATP-dependent DNA helicase UvrD/PcrA
VGDRRRLASHYRRGTPSHMMADGRIPREGQQAALALSARIGIVRAVPGSGKTWLLAEVLRRELECWSDAIGGIASLSFTNVARDEICRALGHTPAHPHFVGTLDSFLFRAIVRPFTTWVFPDYAAPRLVPAEFVEHMGDNHWGFDSLSLETGRGAERVNIFEFTFVDKHKCGTAKFSYRTKGGFIQTSLELSKRVLARKQALWRSSGRMSHSDVAFVAMSVLRDRKRGREALEIILRRYPFLLVDELQDTGRYHSMAVRCILADKRARGFVVGDPDQAIYGFNGAQPVVFDHFDQLEGSKSVTLDISHRCAERICRVASALSSTGMVIRPKPGAAAGRATLLVHADDSGIVADLVEEMANNLAQQKPAAVVTLVTRRNEEVEVLAARAKLPVAPKLGSAPLDALYKAVVHWRSGRGRHARAAAEAALGRVLFRSPNPGRAEMDRVGIAPLEWRQAVGEAVLLADAIVDGESFFTWGTRVREGLLSLLTRYGWLDRCEATKPRMPAKRSHDTRVPIVPRASMASTVRIKTVHAAKGETHDVTVLYVATATSPAACPSATWWSDSADLEEERRIAFVAASRPRDQFVLCVHIDTYDRLREQHPEFVALFEVAIIADTVNPGRLPAIPAAWNAAQEGDKLP